MKELEELGNDPSEQELANFVKNKVGESRQKGYRASFESQWITNIAYAAGYSGVRYDAGLKQFRTIDGNGVGLRANRIHINKILPTLQNRLARLTRARPKYLVRPNSSDSEDKEASRLGNQVLDNIWETQKMNAKYIELIDWAQKCGHSYFKVCWDSEGGEIVEDPETGQVDYEGEIRIDVVSGFEVFPDPLAKTLDECQYLIHCKVRKLDYFRTRYPERGQEVEAEDTWLMSLQYESRINNMNPQSSGSQGGAPNIQEKDSAIEMAYYERPCRKYPQGRMIVVANGVVLEDKPLPVGKIPFVKFDDILLAGKYYGEAVTSHLRSIQDQYNNVITRRAKWTNLLLAGKYIAARGHGLSQEALNDQSGEVLEYDPVPNGGMPQALPVPNIPSYAYQEEDYLEKNFNEVAGINEVSKGQAPGAGITAAIALQYLSEQDDTRIGVQARRNELSMSEFFKLVLMYAGEYYQTPRLIKIAGPNNSYLVKEFQGADLKGNYDVMVVEGSTVPSSVTAKRDYVITYYNLGLLGDPADPATREKVAKMLEFGDLSDTWQDYGLDQNQVKEEINTIKRGELPDVSEFDNHQFALRELNRFRKTTEYKAMDPMKQALLKQLMDIHMDFMLDAQMGPPPEAPDLQAIQDEQMAMPPQGIPMGGPVGLPPDQEIIDQELINTQGDL